MAEVRTLATTVDQLRCRGYTASFEPSEGRLRVPGRATAYRPDELMILEHYRFEGVSDPDDLAVVYAIEAGDGTRGIVVDAYGPYADPALEPILRDMPVRPDAGPAAA